MARPYDEVIAEVDGGALRDLISKKLAIVVAAVNELEKPGKLTIELIIKPNGSNKIFLDSKVKAAAPEQALDTAMFFANDAGDLSRRDPEQLKKLGMVPTVAAMPAKLEEVG